MTRTVKGTILINDNKMNFLFDLGCTHSFIASQLVKSLGLQTSPLSKSFRITAAIGDSKVTKWGLINLSLAFRGMPMCGVSFCMNWKGMMNYEGWTSCQLIGLS